MGRVREGGNKSFGAVAITDFANLNDEEVIVIGDPLNGGKTFEWDDDDAVTEGNVAVEIGANDAECITNLMDAINDELASSLVAYVDPEDDTVLRIEGIEAGALFNLAFTTDMADAGNTIAASGDDTLTGGSNDENRSRAAGEYTVTAIDVAAENVMIPTPFTAPKLGHLFVLDADGVPQYITDKITIAAQGRIQIVKNGATNLAADDVVYWEVWSGE